MKRKSKRMKAFVLAVCILVSLFGGISAKPRMVYAADDYPAGYKSLALDACIDEWKFYNRECTSFVAWCLNSRNGVAFHNYYGGVQWGNAGNWGDAARKCGITVDMNPAKGSVWWTSSGHVAWVSSVDGSNVHIEEYNYDYNGNYHERTVAANSASGYIHIKDIPLTPPTVSEGQIIGADEGGYMLQCRVTGSDVSSVKVASWVDGNGQGDLKWSDMVRQADGVTYKYYVAYSDHGNIVGNYQNHIYAYNSAGEGFQSVYFSIGDKPEPPTVSEGQIIGVDEGGYMLQCRVTGSDVSSVKVASWVDGNGQGDLKWSDMVRQADGVTYKYYVAYSDHGNIVGNYQNHIYAYNSVGEGVQSVYFSVEDKPEISDIHITDADSDGYTIECKIDSYNILSSTQVATWTTSNGKDDLQWENLERQPDGLTYKCYIPYSSHNNEKGPYENLIYAKSITGEESQMITHCNELHNWNEGSVLKEAKCDETGLKEYTCIACNETKREEIPAAHNEDSGTVTKQPTETETGMRTYKCSICQKELRTEEIAKLLPSHKHDYETSAWKADANSHWKECECGEKSAEAAHRFAWIIDKAATEESEGIKHEECEICGYKRNIGTVIEKLAADHKHDYETSAWKSDTESHWKECECGAKFETKKHDFGNWKAKVQATCTDSGLQGRKCTVCGYEETQEIDKTGHFYTDITTKATTKKDGSIVEKCSKCGDEKNKIIIYAVSNIALSKTSYTYNGKTQKPSVTVKDSKGNVLKNNVDYTVSFPKGMKNVGRYTVTVILKGNYSGTISESFNIVPKGTSISKVTAKKKGFTIKWKKQKKQTTGYEIAYSTSSRFAKKSTKVTDAGKSKTTSKTVSKLKAKKKYYVRIRTYKTVKINGKSVKLYSDWSKAKAVTTKK